MEENSENVDESDPHSIEGSIKEDVSFKEEGDNNGFIGEIAEISEEKENKNGSFTCKYEWIYICSPDHICIQYVSAYLVSKVLSSFPFLE